MTSTIFDRAEKAYHNFVPIEGAGYTVVRNLDAKFVHMTNELENGNPVNAEKYAGSILTLCALFGDHEHGVYI